MSPDCLVIIFRFYFRFSWKICVPICFIQQAVPFTNALRTSNVHRESTLRHPGPLSPSPSASCARPDFSKPPGRAAAPRRIPAPPTPSARRASTRKRLALSLPSPSARRARPGSTKPPRRRAALVSRLTKASLGRVVRACDSVYDELQCCRERYWEYTLDHV